MSYHLVLLVHNGMSAQKRSLAVDATHRLSGSGVNETEHCIFPKSKVLSHLE